MRRVVVIVLALVVLAPTLALAQAYRCRFDNVVRDACCCPGEGRDGGREGDAGERDAPAMKATCCCEVIAGSAPDASERAATTAGVHVAAPVMIAVVATAAAPPRVERIVVPVGTSSRAPPEALFVRHCSLLL